MDKKYRMYVDEVGNSDLGSSDNPNHRYLSLTGVIMEIDYVQKVLHPKLEHLKSSYFNSHPDDPIILHRKEMVNAKPPFSALQDKEVKSLFDQELLLLLAELEYSVITVCIDKKRHRETYQVWRYDPYHYCMAMLVERFCLLLERIQGKGDVMAESRGGKEDIRLKKSFHGICEKGTDYIQVERIQAVLTSSQLKVKPKTANIGGLQIADVIAHPSRCEILNENNLLGRELAPFAQHVIRILQTKYDQHHGRIYGKKFI